MRWIKLIYYYNIQSHSSSQWVASFCRSFERDLRQVKVQYVSTYANCHCSTVVSSHLCHTESLHINVNSTACCTNS
ncbi:hypothetical protein XELAEV_18024737mg [Xenopus laevis]|uniref:Uncharacterized protein n=1 Tax=Xenopus laevis TaxID=8355 RepID=A0A974CZG9_XENLA|nr:hypothetical protein XELAEV_18024737mg [Xenopus laevis]